LITLVGFTYITHAYACFELYKKYYKNFVYTDTRKFSQTHFRGHYKTLEN